MRRLWLLFAQTVTVGLALWFIVASLKPHWAGALLGTARQGGQVTTTEVPVLQAPSSQGAQASYRDAAQRSMPAVVNIYTTKGARQPKSPFMDDPLFRRFFGDQQEDQQFSLGSGVVVSSQGYVLTNNHDETRRDERICQRSSRRTSARV